MSDEKTDLEHLMASPGWLRLVEISRHKWKDGYPTLIKLAIQEALATKSDVGAAVAKVDYASDQINQLLSWPKERLAQLARVTETTQTSFTRGGYDVTPSR